MSSRVGKPKNRGDPLAEGRKKQMSQSVDFVCVCMCVCMVRERDGKRGEGGRKGENVPFLNQGPQWIE